MHPDLSQSNRNLFSGSNILCLLLEGLEELSLHPTATMCVWEGINILRQPIKSPNAFIALGSLFIVLQGFKLLIYFRYFTCFSKSIVLY